MVELAPHPSSTAVSLFQRAWGVGGRARFTDGFPPPPSRPCHPLLTFRATRPIPHGATRLVQAMPAWSVKPDVFLPGVVDAFYRVYGHFVRLRPCMTIGSTINTHLAPSVADFDFWCSSGVFAWCNQLCSA